MARTVISTLIKAALIAAVLFGCIGAAPVGAQSTPPATPPATPGNEITLRQEFQAIKQGQIGIIGAVGGNLARGTANVMDRAFPCYPTREGLACIMAAPIDQPVRDYALTLNLTRLDGTVYTRQLKIAVARGDFIAELFTLPGNLNYLLRDDVQANEDDRLTTAYSIITPARYWEGQFSPPVPNPVVVSLFGTVRTYTNNNSVRRHTGVDFRASIGTPILASANGRVALSRPMDIHGNNVVIDHGWGIYTEYAHLSERYVVPGQWVLQGDVIGLSGNTGRSTGPHIHWEIAVAGVWVSPVLFYPSRLPQ